MKKLESSLKNMAIVLTTVSVVAGGLLGYVNELTKEPIERANSKAHPGADGCYLNSKGQLKVGVIQDELKAHGLKGNYKTSYGAK